MRSIQLYRQLLILLVLQSSIGLISSNTFGQQRYTIRSLVTPANTFGRYTPRVGGLNNLGQVAFSAATPLGNAEDTPDHLLFFDGTTTHAMPSLGGRTSSYLGLSDTGILVGAANPGAETYIDNRDEERHPVRAFFSRDDENTILPTPETLWSVASGVNNVGEIVGHYNTAVSQNAFIWRPVSGFEDLGTFEGEFAYPVDINDHGGVLINSYHREKNLLYGDSYYYNGVEPLVYNDGEFFRLPRSEFGLTFGSAINGLGAVVGSFHAIPGQEPHAFIWDQERGFRDIGDDGEFSRAADINDQGVVVGTITIDYPFITEAFIYDEDNGKRRLNDLLDPADRWVVLEHATHINNQGQILGIGRSKDYRWSQVFLMSPIPVPEPSSITLITCGLLLGIARRVWVQRFP